ncbi:hypothetical protein RFI_08363 [Reticulomyxa filosa]|uniref:Uncharacterized protein n=1 Tax=Reticulomyxa filosa TaxID=46433 RepID=X6NSM9_RETFI|nr:hypothetical protein RFI_08363 [Reticulomyxa filosa]|eukprot:ETO28764.1 hypothetical protein RFI_08363 [Reticulomyxa filosa]
MSRNNFWDCSLVFTNDFTIAANMVRECIALKYHGVLLDCRRNYTDLIENEGVNNDYLKAVKKLQDLYGSQIQIKKRITIETESKSKLKDNNPDETIIKITKLLSTQKLKLLEQFDLISISIESIEELIKCCNEWKIVDLININKFKKKNVTMNTLLIQSLRNAIKENNNKFFEISLQSLLSISDTNNYFAIQFFHLIAQVIGPNNIIVSSGALQSLYCRKPLDLIQLTTFCFKSSQKRCIEKNVYQMISVIKNRRLVQDCIWSIQIDEMSNEEKNKLIPMISSEAVQEKSV